MPPNPPAPAVINTSVLITIGSILLFEAAIAALVAVLAPAQLVIILAFLGGTSTVIVVGLMNLVKTSELHAAVNSRMDQMLDFQKQLATSNATLAEREKRASEDTASAVATAAATGTHTTTTTTTTLDSPAQGEAAIVVAPPIAAPVSDYPDGPTPSGPPVSPGGWGPDGPHS